MEAMINGKTTPLKPQTTLGDLIALYRLKPDVVIIEHNGAIVKQPAWAGTAVKENDRIELITFVGGG